MNEELVIPLDKLPRHVVTSDPMYKEGFRAGMLAAAEICEQGYEQGIGAKYQGDVFAAAIREAAKS
jgi:hypothetical protein